MPTVKETSEAKSVAWIFRNWHYLKSRDIVKVITRVSTNPCYRFCITTLFNCWDCKLFEFIGFLYSGHVTFQIWSCLLKLEETFSGTNMSKVQTQGS